MVKRSKLFYNKFFWKLLTVEKKKLDAWDIGHEKYKEVYLYNWLYGELYSYHGYGSKLTQEYIYHATGNIEEFRKLTDKQPTNPQG